MQDFKKKLSGGFDLLFLFGSGIKKFEGTREEAMQSLTIPCVLFLGNLAFAAVEPPMGMETGFPTSVILSTVSLHFIFSYLLSLYFVALVARHMKVQKSFWLYFAANNWTSLAMTLATLPIALAGVFDVIQRPESDRIWAIIAVYGYVVTACIARRAFVINWQLSGAIAVGLLLIGHELWRLLFFMKGLDMPW